MSDLFILDAEGSALLEELHLRAREEDAICQNAPIIWDAEFSDDAKVAIEGCLGRKATEDSEGFPPCPLIDLCLKTANAVKATAGVWGGKDFGTYPKRKKKS